MAPASVTSLTAYTLATVSAVVGAEVFALVLYLVSRKTAREETRTVPRWTLDRRL
jgi:hypothetical protein